jgi:colicin import membrane protein
MLSNEWKLPLNVAIGLHVLVILGALYLPGIFKAKPRFADIYSVSIINIAEPTAGPPPSIKAQPVKAQAATPPPVIAPPKKIQKIQKAAPIAEAEKKAAPVPEKVVPVAQKSISLKPLKKKKIQEIKPQENQAREQEIERNNRQRLAEAIREEELLSEQAKLAQDALEAERKLLQPQQLSSNLQTTSSVSSGNRTSSSSAAAGSSSSLLESQYLAAIRNRLDQFWAPPEYLRQDPNLTAVVVITINLDGKVANMLFESKSGNRVFDQFVIKTLEAAAPMPPIPLAMRKQRFEIGLIFKPGSIQ